MPTILEIYDQSVKDWVDTVLVPTFAPIGKPVQVLFGTPDRAFAEPHSGQVPTHKRLSLPRITITRGDYANAPERFINSKYRKLGAVTASRKEILEAKRPTPINIPYQIDMWAEYLREMQPCLLTIMEEFAQQYKYLCVPVPAPFGDKLTFFKDDDGRLTDNSDLEPGERQRYVRFTKNLQLEGYLYPATSTPIKTARSIRMEWNEGDLDSSVPLEVTNVPLFEDLFNANGILTSFGPTPVARLSPGFPIIERTLIVDAVIGGTVVRGIDDGDGLITEVGSTSLISSGTVDYDDGLVSITYSTPPDASTKVRAGYFTVDPEA